MPRIIPMVSILLVSFIHLVLDGLTPIIQDYFIGTGEIAQPNQ